MIAQGGAETAGGEPVEVAHATGARRSSWTASWVKTWRSQPARLIR